MAKTRSKAELTPTPGDQIKAARKAKGWTQEELGQKLGGITRQAVSAIESWRQRQRPLPEWLVKHQNVWEELGLDRWFFAAGETCCPTCKRPWPK